MKNRGTVTRLSTYPRLLKLPTDRPNKYRIIGHIALSAQAKNERPHHINKALDISKAFNGTH